MTDLENENGTLTDMSSKAESTYEHIEYNADMPEIYDKTNESCDADECGIEENNTDTEHRRAERAEYERLIRTRFKEFYTDDTQRMINKRFKRYKGMEQRLSGLEERYEALEKREKELDRVLAEERARVERETEQRVMAEVRSNRLRPCENGYSPKRMPSPTDVSRLTKSQRADIAKRAQNGEKITF